MFAMMDLHSLSQYIILINVQPPGKSLAFIYKSHDIR